MKLTENELAFLENPQSSKYKIGNTVYRKIDWIKQDLITNDSSTQDISTIKTTENQLLPIYKQSDIDFGLNKDEREFFLNLDVDLVYNELEKSYTNSINLPNFITNYFFESIINDFEKPITKNEIFFNLVTNKQKYVLLDYNKVNESEVIVKLEFSSENPSFLLDIKSDISNMISRLRKKAPLTHFISIPVDSPTIIKNYIAFREDVLGKKYPGISPFHFIHPNKLHFTLLLLRLYSEEELHLCFDLLDKLSNSISHKIKTANIFGSSKPTFSSVRKRENVSEGFTGTTETNQNIQESGITNKSNENPANSTESPKRNKFNNLKDIYTFSDNKADVSVVYTTFEDSEESMYHTITEITELIIKNFESEGLLDIGTLRSQRLYQTSKDELGLKLHCTLLNAKYLPRYSADKTYSNKTFNAKRLFQDFESYDFGRFEPKYLELNSLKGSDIEKYLCLKRLSL